MKCRIDVKSNKMRYKFLSTCCKITKECYGKSTRQNFFWLIFLGNEAAHENCLEGSRNDILDIIGLFDCYHSCQHTKLVPLFSSQSGGLRINSIRMYELMYSIFRVVFGPTWRNLLTQETAQDYFPSSCLLQR